MPSPITEHTLRPPADDLDGVSAGGNCGDLGPDLTLFGFLSDDDLPAVHSKVRPR